MTNNLQATVTAPQNVTSSESDLLPIGKCQLYWTMHRIHIDNNYKKVNFVFIAVALALKINFE